MKAKILHIIKEGKRKMKNNYTTPRMKIHIFYDIVDTADEIVGTNALQTSAVLQAEHHLFEYDPQVWKILVMRK